MFFFVLSVQAKHSLQLNIPINVINIPCTFPVMASWLGLRWTESPLCVYNDVNRSANNLCAVTVTLGSVFCNAKQRVQVALAVSGMIRDKIGL